MKVRKAIIPAAGLGTRFLPATKAMLKEIYAYEIEGIRYDLGEKMGFT